MSEIVLLDVSDRIASVTLNRPEARNALSCDLITELRPTVRQAEADDDVDVIIVTGADPAFCAGLDLKELGSGGGALAESGATGGPTRSDRGPLPAWRSRSSARSTAPPSPAASSSH